MTERQLTDVLTRIADQARPARVATDTWPRGRRRHRINVVTTVVAIAAVLAGGSLLLTRADQQAYVPADQPGPVVPSAVYPPFTGQDTVAESLGGPAAILVAGDHELRGSDVWGWEGRSLVVGVNGSYRLARTVGETSAGFDGLLLSPDGRYLAGWPWLEGFEWTTARDQTAVFDLTTGAKRLYAGGFPVAWAPDGRSLLVRDKSSGANVGELGLVDLDGGKLRRLPDLSGTIRLGNFAAFSPDGKRLALATTEALHIVDLTTGTMRKLYDFSARDRLAGPGAWLPDGKRIAIYYMGGCDQDRVCTETDLGQRIFQIHYLDAETGQDLWGTPGDGPRLQPAQGLAARLLGWQQDGDAVVAVYQPEKGLITLPDDVSWSETDWRSVGGVELKEFRADGTSRNLVDLPESALFVEVPAKLLDSFGGPAPSWPEGAARRLLAIYWPLGQFGLLLLGIVLTVVGLRLHRRWRRHGST